tara:strand:+ start:10413 stop:11333 length:921 start_codon:yes stop_codon:yes gene_type:complete
MNIKPENQTSLYGLNNHLNEFIDLYKREKLPNKILLSGSKGIGKSTLSYHLINYVLSLGENYTYDINKSFINSKNVSFKLIQNKSSPNFTLIDIQPNKKSIDISQIRELIINMNKSSFNSKPRFILIDNIEFLNLNSVNALLKILEEPTYNTYFILINNNKKILSTIKSRCINYKISISNQVALEICNKLLDENTYNLINKDLLDYYFTPGKIYRLINFSKENNINLKTLNLKDLLLLIINESHYKNETSLRFIIYDLIELFLLNKFSLEYSNFFTHFIKRLEKVKKFNLDDESLFLELKTKLLNG